MKLPLERPFMRIHALPAELSVILLASRPQYLGASAAPVLVGSALGYAMTGSFSVGLFLLATISIIALHAGSNVVNDYFDHLSRNDWVNDNPTPFSGGRQFRGVPLSRLCVRRPSRLFPLIRYSPRKTCPRQYSRVCPRSPCPSIIMTQIRSCGWCA